MRRKWNLQVVPVVVAMVVALFVGIKTYNALYASQPTSEDFKALEKRVEKIKSGKFTSHLGDKTTDWRFAYVLTVRTPAQHSRADAVLVFDNVDRLISVTYGATNPIWIAVLYTVILTLGSFFAVWFSITKWRFIVWYPVYMLRRAGWDRHRS